MISRDQVPLMTQSDSLLQFGNNGYAKPATALTVLRETVMGRELFDPAFKEYANRWRFKRPTPYDFFRTMEESSGIDLDWFWRGWFYSTDHVDISLDKVVKARLDTRNPEVEEPYKKAQASREPASLTASRNTQKTVVERDPSTRDYYDSLDEYEPTVKAKKAYAKALQDMDPEEREALAVTDNFYHLSFRNIGGLVMPIPLKLDYSDGSSETLQIPAEVWRRNPRAVTWQLVTPKTLVSAEVDPNWEIADANRDNNPYPRRIQPATLKVKSFPPARNRMKDMERQVSPDSLTTRPAPEK